MAAAGTVPLVLDPEDEDAGWAVAQENDPTNTKDLDYSGQDLSYLPPEIFFYFALTRLNFSNNKLSFVPKDISQLSILEELYLSHNNLGKTGRYLEFPLPKLSVLRISHNQLLHVPQQIGMLTNLTVLDLSHNNISELPAGIGSLSKLHILHLEHNQLQGLRPEIYNMSELKEIYAFNNKIKTLQGISFPPSLEQIDLGNNLLSFVHPNQFVCTKKLRHLGLSNNNICFLDEELFLENLHCLEEFYMANNQLQSIPFSIGNLSALKKLSLSCNRIWEIPVSIGFLSSLESLYLNSNSIEVLPRSFGNLPSLSYLDLSYNQLFELPPTIGRLSNLEQCKIMYNNLTSLPTMLTELKLLNILDATGNENLHSPPMDICQQGVAHIMEYLSSIPLSVNELQEGWEIVEPTREDIEVEFGLNSHDITPYLERQDNYDVAESSENPIEEKKGWISYTFNLLSSSVFGSSDIGK